ncbi:MAG: hypothetical protein QG646_2302 [Euryarchaeota archaeon]|nr:hypothetical protein [Euryarchaeota archaeon]
MKKGDKAYSLLLASIFILLFLILFLFIESASTAQSGSSTEYAYVPNEKTNDVSIINTTTNTVISTVPVGNNPVGVAVNHNGTRVYVTNYGNDDDLGYTFSIINTGTDEVITRLVDEGKGIKPFGVAITPDETLYVSSFVTEKVYAINPINNTIFEIEVGSKPFGVAITPDGKWVYVANSGNNTVSVIDTATNNVIDTVSVGTKPYGVAVSPDGAKVYVTNQGSDNISVIDTVTNNVTATVKVVKYPSGIAVTPDGTKVYVANHCKYVGTVSVINTTKNTVTENIIVDENPCGVSVTHDGKWVYVTTAGSENYSGSVSVINTTTNTVIPSRVFVGNRPSGIGQFIGSFQESRVETVITLASSSDQYLVQSLIGKPITLTAKVSTTSQGTKKPSGKVIFMDGSTPIENGIRDLTSGQATLDTSSLSFGSHIIRARYMGDTNFRPSTSPPFQLTVGSNAFWPQIFSGSILAVLGGIIALLVAAITKKYL